MIISGSQISLNGSHVLLIPPNSVAFHVNIGSNHFCNQDIFDHFDTVPHQHKLVLSLSVSTRQYPICVRVPFRNVHRQCHRAVHSCCVVSWAVRWAISTSLDIMMFETLLLCNKNRQSSNIYSLSIDSPTDVFMFDTTSLALCVSLKRCNVMAIPAGMVVDPMPIITMTAITDRHNIREYRCDECRVYLEKVSSDGWLD